jgi:hypothetical protein
VSSAPNAWARTYFGVADRRALGIRQANGRPDGIVPVTDICRPIGALFV